jgi:hypothetical protein
MAPLLLIAFHPRQGHNPRLPAIGATTLPPAPAANCKRDLLGEDVALRKK